MPKSGHHLPTLGRNWSVLTCPLAKGDLLILINSCGRDIVRMLKSFIGVLMFALCASVPAFAVDCPGNADALSTSRVVAISPNEFSNVGTMQYKQTLPLDDDEVVITFDARSTLALH